LLFKAKSYIDNFEDVLIKKYNETYGGGEQWLIGWELISNLFCYIGGIE
jgi:hypothetical protein